MKITIGIPAFNEEKQLPKILPKLMEITNGTQNKYKRGISKKWKSKAKKFFTKKLRRGKGKYLRRGIGTKRTR